MAREELIGQAVERLWTTFSSQRDRSGWANKLKGAGYMKWRNDYEGTEVPEFSLHDDTAVDSFDTYVDGFVGHIMPQDDDWLKVMPRVRWERSRKDREYAGFGALLDEDGSMKVMDTLTDIVLMEFGDSDFYNPIRTFFKDAEVFGIAYLLVEENPDGGVLYTEMDPQECCVAEDPRGNVDVFVRHWRVSPVDAVRTWRDARLSRCWETVRRGGEAEEATVEVYEAILPSDYIHDPKTGEVIQLNGGDARKVAHVVWIPMEQELVVEGSFDEMPVLVYSPVKVSKRSPYGTGIVYRNLEEIVNLDDDMNLKRVLFKKNVNPPMVVHNSLRGNYSSKSGAVVFTGDINNQTAKPLFVEGGSNNYQAIVNDIEEAKNRIRQLMNADLFRTLMASTDSRKTAYEVSELKNEAVTLLSMKIGAFVKRVIEPAVKRTLKIKIRRGEVSVNDQNSIQSACDYIDNCTILMNSVFIRKVQGYLRYQGLVSGLQFLGAYAQLEQTQSVKVLEMDKFLRSGLYGAGFPAYCIKEKRKLEEERNADAEMQRRMMEAQMNEQNAKAFSNTGRGMQSLNSAGVTEEQLEQGAQYGGGYGAQQ